MKTLRRRSFLQSGATAAAAAAIPAAAQDGAPAATVVVVHGKDIPRMLEAGVAKLGGWGAFVKDGARVTLKANVAWNSTPAQGGNTHPDLVRACVLAVIAKGASKVSIPENTCHPETATFKASGVEKAVQGTPARLYRPAKEDYRPLDIPKGQTIKTANVPKDVLDCDCLINMPVAKSHSATTLTLGLKNWMGAVTNDDRRGWHRLGLHQCIADFSTAIRPKLTVIDATRIMLTKGPQGPGELDHPDELILSTDPVAADAYAATLFKKEPFEIGYIKIAHEMGLGCGDLKRVKVERLEV